MSKKLTSRRCDGIIAAGIAIGAAVIGAVDIGDGTAVVIGGIATGAAVTIGEVWRRAENSALSHFEAIASEFR